MMKLKRKHRILDRIQKKSIRKKIKQILQKRQTNQIDDNDDSIDYLEKRCHNERDWKQKIQKIIFNKKIFSELKTKPISNDLRKLVYKKHKKHHRKHHKKIVPIVVDRIAHDPNSITGKTRHFGEVRGSHEAPWRLYYDGASVKSRKHAGAGAVLQNIKHHTLDEFAQYIGPQTMHVAEYVGLLSGLRLALNWKVDHLCCYGDSLIVHNQVQGLWKTRTFKMAFLCFHVQEFLKLFKSVKFVHIRRKKNLHAAKLAHEAINIHWDRLALVKSQCKENEQKKKNDENKRNDNDKSDFNDGYYEY